MKSPQKTQDYLRVRQEKADKKASKNTRHLRRNRRGVWVSNDT